MLETILGLVNSFLKIFGVAGFATKVVDHKTQKLEHQVEEITAEASKKAQRHHNKRDEVKEAGVMDDVLPMFDSFRDQIKWRVRKKYRRKIKNLIDGGATGFEFVIYSYQLHVTYHQYDTEQHFQVPMK